MSHAMNCDGCGNIIAPKTVRFHVSKIDASVERKIFEPFGNTEWMGDFCTVGCLASWAMQQEIENHPS